MKPLNWARIETALRRLDRAETKRVEAAEQLSELLRLYVEQHGYGPHRDGKSLVMIGRRGGRYFLRRDVAKPVAR